jgi:hypothetical protein
MFKKYIFILYIMNSTTPKIKYIRCAKGTRRHRKTKQCRSVNRKRCPKGSRRSRGTGKCEKKTTK